MKDNWKGIRSFNICHYSCWTSNSRHTNSCVILNILPDMHVSCLEWGHITAYWTNFTDRQFNALFSSLFKASNKEIQRSEISEYQMRHCISRRPIQNYFFSREQKTKNSYFVAQIFLFICSIKTTSHDSSQYYVTDTSDISDIK
jgi:hypothetical protein